MLKQNIKELLIDTPLETIARGVWNAIRKKRPYQFTTTGEYWESRYANSESSGAGSYGRLRAFKAEVLNEFVTQHKIMSVIEFGSGDGNQLRFADYPSYIGVDVSETAVLACREQFAKDTSKTFVTVSDYSGQRADLALSLDVIYHLIEDEIFTVYMKMLFDAADRFVIIYSSNKNEQTDNKNEQHVRHHKFTDWVDENRGDFLLHAHIPNKFPFEADKPNTTSFADFYIYERSS